MRHDPLTVVQANYVFIERGPQVLDLRERRAGRIRTNPANKREWISTDGMGARA